MDSILRDDGKNCLEARSDQKGGAELVSLSFSLKAEFLADLRGSKSPGTDCYCRGNYGEHATLRALQFF